MSKVRYTTMEKIENYHDRTRAGYSDFVLLYHFKVIRYQCKWDNRPIDTLLKYINELEYREIKYRLWRV